MGQGGISARIAVHDFAGHAFILQLSRELAARGHAVAYYWCDSNMAPHGDLTAPSGPRLQVESVTLRRPFEKYNASMRLAQEVELGARMIRLFRQQPPDVILSANVPVVTNLITTEWANRRKARSIFWAQDLQSGLARGAAAKRRSWTGFAVHGLHWAERRVARRSDGVVAITPDFLPVLDEWGVPKSSQAVVKNWAPLEDLPLRPKRNPWSEALGLVDRLVFLYSGTLGIKHDPELLIRLAESLAGRLEVKLVVVSEGSGANWLQLEIARRGLKNVLLLPYQAFEHFPDVLATGDVLVALLDSSAGQFSVPSKLLSYHCAGRPILMSTPPTNLAARILGESGAGFAVSPGDERAFLEGACKLADQPTLRAGLGRNARTYAENTFGLRSIADRFEEIMRIRGGGPDHCLFGATIGVSEHAAR